MLASLILIASLGQSPQATPQNPIVTMPAPPTKSAPPVLYAPPKSMPVPPAKGTPQVTTTYYGTPQYTATPTVVYGAPQGGDGYKYHEKYKPKGKGFHPLKRVFKGGGGSCSSAGQCN